MPPPALFFWPGCLASLRTQHDHPLGWSGRPGARVMATQLLSPAHAAGVLDCSPGHVYNLIARGLLRAVEIKAEGKRPKTRIREDDLQAYIDAQTRVA